MHALLYKNVNPSHTVHVFCEFTFFGVRWSGPLIDPHHVGHLECSNTLAIEGILELDLAHPIAKLLEDNFVTNLTTLSLLSNNDITTLEYEDASSYKKETTCRSPYTA